MTSAIRTNLGALANPRNIAEGSVSKIKKVGAFYIFYINLADHDRREYSFTNSDRAFYMRKIMIEHLVVKYSKELKIYK